MKRKSWMYSWLFVIATVTSSQGTTWFVNVQTGNDSNSGRSAAKPFQTIQKAVAEAASRPGPDVIQIAAGMYPESVVIQDPDSVTLSGRPGVVIEGPSAKKEVIYVQQGNVTVEDVKVTGGKYGIRGKPLTPDPLQSPICLTLRRVESVDNPGRGLRADNVLEVSISDCQFLRNGNDGIKVGTDEDLDRTQANLTINNTIISGSSDDGIDLEKLGNIRLVNVVVQNTVEGEEPDDGLSIDDSVSVFIAGCTFVNNAADGIDIDDTDSVTIVSSLSAGNGAGGLQVKSEVDDEGEDGYFTQSVRIVDSGFLGNGDDGIWISDENGAIQAVSLHSIITTDNVDSGLDFDVACPVKLSAITSANNGSPEDVP